MAINTNILRTVKALRTKINGWRKAEETVAIVPTMGALHDGHLSLVKAAKRKADRVIVSIFVNPAQFGKNEDLSKYPRNEKADKAKLDALGVDLIFAPKLNQVYPEGFSTTVTVNHLTDCLCGTSRPTHFSGVTTVVSKLLMLSLPDIAVFGEKDYQQLLVIQQMVKDLHIPVKILGVPTFRERDGLAMSSRNVYLTKQQREKAPMLYATLKETAKKISEGSSSGTHITKAKKSLEDLGFKMDYLELRDTKTLATIKGKVSSPARLFVAVYLGKTRLIDNIKVSATKK